MKYYIESYGCSMNSAETEQIRGFLEKNNFSREENPSKASLLIVNSCAVKEPTENKMLRRIKALNEISKKTGAKILVCGCLPKVNEPRISEISKSIIQCVPKLSQIAKALDLKEEEFSPQNPAIRTNNLVSIIAIESGCLSNCSFCGTKIARGSLKSFTIKELNERFQKNLLETKEIWLTGQDTGCYGKDIGTNLIELLKVLLKNKCDFRIRVGMMSPQYLHENSKEFLELFEDERLYKFFHIPIQSGSDRILQEMKRRYKIEYCIELFSKIRKKFPQATISTDIIAGFPGETEKDFNETIEALKKIKPDIVNISRYGKRPNTIAAKMPNQILERTKKERSRKLAELCKKIALERNKKMVGTIQTILVSEKGKNDSFAGRTRNYKVVVLKENFCGKFLKVKITKAKPTYLEAKILEK